MITKQFFEICYMHFTQKSHNILILVRIKYLEAWSYDETPGLLASMSLSGSASFRRD